ncbi:MAG: hypothetical protein JST05_10385, partial [Acidobacteria bacterium]|nr:hypothetical protein [Acidobacteriota bacterium]
MTQRKDFKKTIRARMEKTGESYTTARAKLDSSPEIEPVEPKWHPQIKTNQKEAQRLLSSALELEPRLTSAGLGVGISGLNHYWSPGEGGPDAEYDRRFRESRNELSDRLLEIAAASDWIRDVLPGIE